MGERRSLGSSISATIPKRSGPSRYRPAQMPITAHAASSTGWVSSFHCQTRSALERNFSAAASSKNPSVALNRASHTPPLGMRPIHCGNRPKTKNGETKASANASIPSRGRRRLPAAAATSSVPRNGAVQVNDPTTKVTPSNARPAVPPSARAQPCSAPKSPGR